MRHSPLRSSLVGGLLAAVLPAAALAQPLGSSFSYQGQLSDSGTPALGLYDLQVCLFATPTQPLPLACAPDFEDVPVEDGLFTLALDFGAGVFDGQQRYLELRVRPGASSGGYTILSPRQLLRATPEALRAASAPWSGLTGVPPGFADGIDNDSGGTVTAITAGTGLSGGTITGSGTLAIANGGVGAAQIAPGSVAAVHIATGSIGAAQVDPSQVQLRLAALCPAGEFLRGIGADGSALCETAPGLPSLAVVDDPPANNVGEPSLAIGVDGLPVISYWDHSSFDLKFARCVDSACRRPAQIRVLDAEGSTGRYSAIAIGSDGLPLISYVDNTNSRLRLARCLDTACADVELLTLDSGIGNLFYTAIAVPPDGHPVIAYQGGGVLRLARCSTPACSGTPSRTVVDATSGVGSHVSMVIGNDGLPLLSYQGNGSLNFIRCTTADCSSRSLAVVDGPAVNVGSHTSIALDLSGRALMSYRDNANGTLKFARCGNANCNSGNSVATVNLGASPGVFDTRVAVGADGSPVIAVVQSGGIAALRLIRCGTLACSADNSIGNVYLGFGSGISPGAPALALGADGLPVVAFSTLNAGSDRKLWLARCGNRSCQ